MTSLRLKDGDLRDREWVRLGMKRAVKGLVGLGMLEDSVRVR